MKYSKIFKTSVMIYNFIVSGSRMIYKIDGLYFITRADYKKYLAKFTKYGNAYKPWTDLHDKELEELVLKEEMSIAELAIYFCRTKGAIDSRMKFIFAKSQYEEIKTRLRYKNYYDTAQELKNYSKESYRDVI
tara:strand:+ start:57 stop:455 length:399 start_codon:yes stop_codon:yes gene_type:complete